MNAAGVNIRYIAGVMAAGMIVIKNESMLVRTQFAQTWTRRAETCETSPPKARA